MKPDTRPPEFRHLSPRQHLSVVLVTLYYRYRTRIYFALLAAAIGLVLEFSKK